MFDPVDFDGDGDLDLVAGAALGYTHRILVNEERAAIRLALLPSHV